MNAIKYLAREFLENETSIAFAVFLSASVLFPSILAVGHLVQSFWQMVLIFASSAFVGFGFESALLLKDRKQA